MWFADFEASLWDRRFEADVAASRLEQLGEEALQFCEKGAALICEAFARQRISGNRWKKYLVPAD
jgi:hypothetical protein